MANEITLSASLQILNGNHKFRKQSDSLQFDQAAVGGGLPGYASIGTSEETITTTDIATLGWAFFKNLDAANYVEIGFSTGVYGIRVEANEIALFRINPGSTIYAKANTAAVKMEIYIFED